MASSGDARARRPGGARHGLATQADARRADPPARPCDHGRHDRPRAQRRACHRLRQGVPPGATADARPHTGAAPDAALGLSCGAQQQLYRRGVLNLTQCGGALGPNARVAMAPAPSRLRLGSVGHRFSPGRGSRRRGWTRIQLGGQDPDAGEHPLTHSDYVATETPTQSRRPLGRAADMATSHCQAPFGQWDRRVSAARPWQRSPFRSVGRAMIGIPDSKVCS